MAKLPVHLRQKMTKYDNIEYDIMDRIDGINTDDLVKLVSEWKAKYPLGDIIINVNKDYDYYSNESGYTAHISVTNVRQETDEEYALRLKQHRDFESAQSKKRRDDKKKREEQEKAQLKKLIEKYGVPS